VTHVPERGLFVYPWDLLGEGVEPTLSALQNDTLCSVVGINCSYHSGRFFHPRHPEGGALPYFRGRLNHRLGGAVSFRPSADLYGDAPLPPVEEPLVEAGVLAEARDACRELGLGFNLWTVVLHNSTLGSAHPELCEQNVFGDVYRFSLNPAHPTVRSYARALVEDICRQFRPDTIMLESPTYLGFVHGDHHELTLANLDELTQLLLSLGFSEASRQGAERHGCNVEVLEREVRSLLSTLIEDERGALSHEFRFGEPVSLLLDYPEIYSYLRYRLDVVTSLLAELREVAAGYGVKVGVTTSIFSRPTSRAWMEGTSLRAASRAVDALLSVSYFPDPAAVQGDILWVKTLSEGRPFDVALDAGHPDALSEENLIAKARIAASEGAGAVFYYNYGLLTRRRLGWVRSANRALLEGA
jgi:hypothetical protein